MPWNEPGSGKSSNSSNGNNGDNRRPNGNRGGNNEIEDMLKNLKDSLGGGRGGNNNRGNGGGGNRPTLPSWLTLPVILIGAILFVGFKSVYTVKEGQESVVLRFGEYNRTDIAGLNFAIWPIETKFQVDTNKIRTVEVGYRGGQAKPKEALMLTNDENIVDVTMAVQYTIKNLQSLIFNVGNVEQRGELDSVVRGATESALREVVGSKTMDDLLTKGRREVDINTKEVLQTILDRYQTGILVESVEIQDAKPPSPVSDAFDDVVKADQDKIRKENDAQAYANDLVPRARGEASRIVQEAEGYKETIVAEATGEAERFNQILTEYQKAPEITRKRLYLETMEQVLSNTSKVMVGENGGNSLMYLPIDKILEKNQSNKNTALPTNKINNSQVESIINKSSRTRSSVREGR
ncbi:MAG: FtsH protease activity modulator HflK [Arenicella sp.]